ncbi:unnamed protein product [Symbiodinium sp. CCMP2456]|nr:unnamed protein product [Symbiodinium sp. CCMP2456]
MVIWSAVALFLLTGLPPSAANAPSASASCPKGYFRNATVLFPCDALSGVAYAPISQEEGMTIRVPPYVKDGQVSVVSSVALTIAVGDPAQVAAMTPLMQGPKSQDWRGLSIEIDAGQVVSEATGQWLGSWRAGITYQGTTPSELAVLIHAEAGAQRHLANISFAYSAYNGCKSPALPTGCDDFARFAARQLVFNWSSWVQSKYESADVAWQKLCDSAMQSVEPLAPGPVPFYIFGDVWSPWPLAALVHPGWREAFRFIDSLGGTPPDGYVQKAEFETAYGLASIYLSMFAWCELLRKQYANVDEAWNALSGAEFGFAAPVDYTRWKTSFWSSYRPEAGMNKASPDEAFVYADANGDEKVSKQEFSSIFFSCAPENANQPPGGAAAHAQKVETAAAPPGGDAAVAAEVPKPKASSARCLYSDTEYVGGSVGLASAQPNLTFCQARCRATPGCAFFTFSHADGNCRMLDIEASWRESVGLISGPVKCVAQVQLKLEDVGETSSLEGKTDLLQLEMAAEFAKYAGIPDHDIRDMRGNAGKVSLSFSSQGGGEILVHCFVDVPPGGELHDIERVAHESEAQRKLLSALRSDTGPGAEMQVAVAVVPGSECFILGTRFTPDLNAEHAAVETATACQVKCTETQGCRFFSYLTTTKICSLQGKSATAFFVEDSLAGPQLCHNLPHESEPSKAELETDHGTIFGNLWFWLILLLVVLLCVAMCVAFRRGRLCPKTWRRQLSRSRKNEEAKLSQHRYMALPPTDQELEQNMLSQAASNESQGSALRPLHPVDFGAKLSGYNGGYNGRWPSQANGSPWSWQVERLSTAPRETPDFATGSPGRYMAQGAWGPSGQSSPSSLQLSPRASAMQEDSPEWMPHFLGAEAVREAYQNYDAAQRHAIPPERSSWPTPQVPQRLPPPVSAEFPHASSMPCPPHFQPNQAGFGSPVGFNQSWRA